MSRTARLALWLGFMALLIAAAYGARASGGPPDRNVLYQYGTALSGAVEYAFVIGIVLAIAGGSTALLAWRPPRDWPRALGLAVVAFVVIYVTTGVLDHYLHAGREQGLTPTSWQPSHAGAYAANVVVVAVVAPFVEETTYRGLGYTLLADYGAWVAIVVTGLLFGLSHGLVEGLPVLTLFGIVLGWLRRQTDSVYPGMLVHAAFNGIALALAVAT